jgi:predicted enzyme related to lactoylglutathione lyase
MTEHTAGVPNFIEIRTPDPEAAAQFYTELFGWRIDDKVSAGYRYARRLDGAVIAGLRQSGGDQPAAWTVYLSTNDIARAMRHAADNDGRVLHSPVDVPGQGEVTVIADPTGAITGLCQPRPGWCFASHTPGTFAWAELLTPRGSAADDFYAQLVGLGSTQIGDATTYDYAVWTPAGHQTPVAGRHQIVARDGGRALWRVYFTVDPVIGTDQALTSAVRLGATVVADPRDIPAGRTAVLTDLTGAQFALLTPAPRA